MREVDIIARELVRLAKKVLPPEGNRKTWKIINDSGSVSYSPTKPGDAEESGPKMKDMGGEATPQDINDIKNSIGDTGGIDINKMIKDEIAKLRQTQSKPQQESVFSEKEKNLPDTVSQPVKTEKEVYESAKEAQEQMLDLLDRGKGLEKTLGLKHFDISKGEEPDYDVEGPVLITAPMKGKERATEKVESDYGGDWSQLQDVVRASVAVDSFDDVKNVMNELRKSGIKVAKKPTDRFANPTNVGYRDIKLNVQYPNGHIGELQLHMKPIIKAKATAHKDYEVVRSIEAKAKKENRDTLTPEEQKTVDEANQKMKATYEKAWEEGLSKKKAASMKTAKTGKEEKVEYHEYEGNPVIVERNKFPVMFVKGKPQVFRDFFKLHHDGNPIDKKRYDELSKRK